MDLIKDGYTKPCRFLRDDGTVSTIRWYPVADDAPTLPFWSVICNKKLEHDYATNEEIGEVWQGIPKFNKKKIPAGIDGHTYCGTIEDFQLGGLYRPDLPPAVYAANGFLACCQGAKLDRGGAGAGGKATYHVLPPLAKPSGAGAGGKATYNARHWTDATAGGVELGGAAGEQWYAPGATRGGIEVGGSAGDHFTAGDATAGGVELGGAAGEQWYAPGATRGGVELGGAAGDEHHTTDATAGGVELGGAAGDQWYAPGATRGGVELGGAAGDEHHTTDATAGGVELGGAAGDVWLPPGDGTAGGVEVGGSAGEQWRANDPTAGGIEIGGQVADTNLPGAPTPGTDCLTAPILALAVPYRYVTISSGVGEQWWRWEIVPGFYLFNSTGLAGAATITAELYQGADCSSLTLLGIISNDTEVVVATEFHAWLRVVDSGAGGTLYTFQLG